MPEVIRVLIVEDLPTDAELNKREVRQVLPECEFLCVETREDFLAALESFRPDIILSDYKLPHFDGMAALKLAREHVREIPFILITGSINEETAVECMKAGAWDYVIKEHLHRLGPALLKTLELKSQRMEKIKAEEQLRKKLDELQRYHNVSVDREFAMIELKKEVNELLKQAGQEEKYRIVGLRK